MDAIFDECAKHTENAYPFCWNRGRTYLGEYLELSNIEAGVQTIGLLRNNISAETVAHRAAMENIDVVPLSRYCFSTSIAEGLQIGFAGGERERN